MKAIKHIILVLFIFIMALSNIINVQAETPAMRTRVSIVDTPTIPNNIPAPQAYVTEEREVELIDEEDYREVLVTGYWRGDSTGSGSCTGTGYCESDFDVNHMGWYTFEGKVVAATATNECYRSNDSGCRSYTTPPDGYLVYSYYDTFTFVFQEQEYEAIVLDSCGACSAVMPQDNGFQRIDIFTTAGNGVGKKQGFVKL